MDKVKRFLAITVPTTACNLRCKYCYLRYCNIAPDKMSRFPVEVGVFQKAIKQERLGGVCMFNFTSSGETLIYPEMVDFIRAVLEEGHYLEVVTNATITRAFDEIVKFPKNLLSHLMFKCSFHYLELKEKGLLDKFFANIRLAKSAGASITVELMPHDELIPFIPEIKRRMMVETGALCHLTVGRDASQPDKLPVLTKLPRKEYERVWGEFGSKMFEYKLSVFERRQCRFCYAGDWMMSVDLFTGEVRQCYQGDVIGNLYAPVPLNFRPIGWECREPHCFNAHAWLTFGCVPGDGSPRYDEMRNRVCQDGTEWLSPEFKNFVHQKFWENNPSISFSKKALMRLRCKGRQLLGNMPILRGFYMGIKRLVGRRG